MAVFCKVSLILVKSGRQHWSHLFFLFLHFYPCQLSLKPLLLLQMFSEFGRGGEGVTKQTFSTVMRDILLGLGDGLEREPVIISPLDGTQLERWAASPEFEIEAVASFAQLDTDSSGQIKAGAIREALKKINVEQGMPPQSDPSVLHLLLAFSLLRLLQHFQHIFPLSAWPFVNSGWVDNINPIARLVGTYLPLQVVWA